MDLPYKYQLKFAMRLDDGSIERAASTGDDLKEMMRKQLKKVIKGNVYSLDVTESWIAKDGSLCHRRFRDVKGLRALEKELLAQIEGGLNNQKGLNDMLEKSDLLNLDLESMKDHELQLKELLIITERNFWKEQCDKAIRNRDYCKKRAIEAIEALPHKGRGK